MASEETKDAARNTVFGAAAVIAAYLINLVLPQEVPAEVRAAVLTLVLAGGLYVFTYIDSTNIRSTIA